MAELRRSQSDQGENSTIAENNSYRSRASSVISTGTKFSIQTMPQSHFNIDGVLDGGSSVRNVTTRPASLYSVRSMAPSLPPYEGHQPMDTLLLTGPNALRLNTLQTAPNDDLQIASSIGNDHEQPQTPSDPENALSMHYGRIVRTIDDNHARQLARIYSAHEQEIAATRDAIDQAYRKEWKAKNREIERIREEAANEIEQTRRETAAEIAAIRDQMETLVATHEGAIATMQKENADKFAVLGEEHQAAIERAKNAIEDLWEGRWNDRTKVGAEEAKRAANEAQRTEQESDKEWIEAIRTLHPELIDEITSAVSLSQAATGQVKSSNAPERDLNAHGASNTVDLCKCPPLRHKLTPIPNPAG